MKRQGCQCIVLAAFASQLPIIASQLHDESGSYSEAIFDVIAKFSGESNFPPSTWARFKSCLESLPIDDTNALVASDRSWEGMIEYALWGEDWGRGSSWREDNPAPLANSDDTAILGASDVTIYEPCNAVSNVAYYHSVLAFCEYEHWDLDDIVRQSLGVLQSIQGFGSFFFHGGQAWTGYTVDVWPTEVYSWILLQNLAERLPYDPIIHDLQSTPRTGSSTDASLELSRILLDDSVYNWNDRIRAIDVPSMFKSYAGFVAIAVHLCLPPVVALEVTSLLATLLLKRESDRDFLINEYEPRMLTALQTANVRPMFWTKARLALAGTGTLIKMLYAFMWQEKMFPGPHTDSPRAIRLGGELMPALNRFANLLTGFDRSSNREFQRAKDVYPGDEYCRYAYGHAIWHEQAANALVDLAYLSSLGDAVIRGERLPYITSIGLLKCLESNKCLSDFDFRSLKQQLSSAIDSCIDRITRSWPQPDTGGFFNCMLPSLLTDEKKRTTSSNTLDSCLVENDCIVFDAFGGMDTARLMRCIGYAGRLRFRSAPCTQHVSPLRLKTCMLSCHGDNLCALECMQKNGQLSSSVDSIVSCLHILLNPEDSQIVDQHWSTCIAGVGETPSPFVMLNELAIGLPKFVECSIGGQCRPSFSSIISATDNVVQCATACRTNDAWGDVLFESSFPRGAACALQCYLQVDHN